MSYPYDLDIAYGSELYTSDTYFTVNLSNKNSKPEPPGPEPDHYTVSWPYSEEYSITPDGYTPTLSDSTYSISVEDQTYLGFTVTPSEGYRLTSYTVDGNTVLNPDGTSVTDSIQVTKNISMSATTEVIAVQHIITLSADSNIAGMSRSVGEWTMNHGDVFDVYAEPKSGYTLSANCSDSTMVEEDGQALNSKTYTIPSVTKDATLSISGVAIPVEEIDVVLPTVTNADIEPVTQSPIPKGSGFIFQLTPDEGYNLGDVVVDGITLSGTQVGDTDTMEYTITNITSTPTIVIENPTVDTNKFYSAKQRGYNPSTQEILEGYFKFNLEDIENQNDREDLSKILPQLKILADHFFYGGDGDASMIIVDSNLESVCESLSSELHTKDWVLRPYYGDSGRNSNIIYLYNDPDNKYPIMFCSNKINYDTLGLLFFDNSHVDFIKNAEEVGCYDSSTGYIYDKSSAGDIYDADLTYNVIEITFSNMSDAISNPNVIYSNGIRVFDRNNVMHFGRYVLDLSKSNPEEVEFIKSKLKGVKIVIDQYFYSGSLEDRVIPLYSISNISSNDVTAVINQDMSLSLYIDSSTESISAHLYVDDVEVSDWNTYSLYHVNDSDKPLESVGWSGGYNSYSDNGYVFDRSNSDLLITGRPTEDCDIRYKRNSGTSSDINHNDGEGQSAVAIIFTV